MASSQSPNSKPGLRPVLSSDTNFGEFAERELKNEFKYSLEISVNGAIMWPFVGTISA